MSGTFTTTTLSVDFGGFVGDGGVPLNAVRNISGPNAVVDKCSVQYARTTGAGPSAFRMEFDVVTTPGAHC